MKACIVRQLCVQRCFTLVLTVVLCKIGIAPQDVPSQIRCTAEYGVDCLKEPCAPPYDVCGANSGIPVLANSSYLRHECCQGSSIPAGSPTCAVGPYSNSIQCCKENEEMCEHSPYNYQRICCSLPGHCGIYLQSQSVCCSDMGRDCCLNGAGVLCGPGAEACCLGQVPGCDSNISRACPAPAGKPSEIKCTWNPHYSCMDQRCVISVNLNSQGVCAAQSSVSDLARANESKYLCCPQIQIPGGNPSCKQQASFDKFLCCKEEETLCGSESCCGPHQTCGVSLHDATPCCGPDRVSDCCSNGVGFSCTPSFPEGFARCCFGEDPGCNARLPSDCPARVKNNYAMIALSSSIVAVVACLACFLFFCLWRCKTAGARLQFSQAFTLSHREQLADSPVMSDALDGGLLHHAQDQNSNIEETRNGVTTHEATMPVSHQTNPTDVPKCIICTIKPRTVRFLPCRHALCCHTCSLEREDFARQCPSCRCYVESFEWLSGSDRVTFMPASDVDVAHVSKDLPDALSDHGDVATLQQRVADLELLAYRQQDDGAHASSVV